MTEEKLLYYLDVKKCEKNDKSVARIFLWIDVIIFIFIVGMGYLFKCITSSFFDILGVCFILTTTIVFCLWYKKINNSLIKVTYLPCILLSQCFKLFYGFFVFSRGELRDFGYPRFSWLHATIAILAINVIVWIILLYSQLYQDVQKLDLQELVDRERKTKINANRVIKAHPWIQVLPVLLPSPYIASKVFREWVEPFGMGCGFYMWLLSCCWLCIAFLYLPKTCVYLKHINLLKPRTHRDG
ncbi:MAG: hypothetical protein IJN63_10260 [Clostridia bacterium]|nr:hypothetical protein [Clostridia bacterium]